MGEPITSTAPRYPENLRPAAPDRGVKPLGDRQERRRPESLLHLCPSGDPLAGPDETGGRELWGDRNGYRRPILRNLRFDLSQRKVLLVFDEAQHLSIECWRPYGNYWISRRHCGLLFAAPMNWSRSSPARPLELEQWRSRFHAGQALPGISEEEAATIVHSELGLGLPQRKIQKLISKSRITDLRNGGQHSYVSARRLFWVIRELQAVANAESTRAPHQ